MDRLVAGADRLGITLNPQQIDQFERFFRELVAWNRRVNLTAIVEQEEVQTRHFLDSMTATQAFHGRPPARALDVGSGAGLPGVPLKILYPEMGLTLLESVMKKVLFLEHLARALALEQVKVVCRRAEELAHDPAHREGYDAVLARAVAPLPTLVELTLPFCKIGGAVIAHKKGDIAHELQQAAFGIEALGGRLRQTRPASVPELADEGHCLVVIEKMAPTPARYPRRAGIPQKRPLKAA